MHVQANGQSAAAHLYQLAKYKDEDDNDENWLIRWAIRHISRLQQPRGSSVGGPSNAGSSTSSAPQQPVVAQAAPPPARKLLF